MIMRWLGPPDQEDPGIDAFRSELEPGDIIFCCSDGLYGYFAPPVAPEGEMAEILEAHRGNLPQALEELVEVALARGGHDNITVAALQLQGGKSGKKEPESREVHPPLREDGMRTVEMNLNPGAMPQE
jgi:serine/threonine protein phosphatase PrpC